MMDSAASGSSRILIANGTDPTSSPGTTIYAYDAIGRKISETYPDNSVLTTAYCGPSTLVTDPTGHWRRSRTDGLALLMEVDEPNAVGATVASSGCPGTGEPIWVTSYGYDTLGDLLSVLQNGSHSRTFTYDMLSRMLTSTNPEVGQITYTYDANSNVNTKKDARNITTTYGYDVLNRPTSRTYSNGDPTVTVTYDQAACLSLIACQNIGYRTKMTDAAGSENWAYQVDPANSRSVHREQRTTNSITKTSTYTLDLAGNLTKIVYPTSRIVNYTYNNANRAITAADSANGITYAKSPATPLSGCLAAAVCYTPQGSVYSMAEGKTSTFTGLNVQETFNTRLQPNEIKASSTAGNAIDITYNFNDANNHNAGHVYAINNLLNTARSQSFSYDQLNRITTAGTFATAGTYCWGYLYSYDSWGNLQQQAAWTPTYNGCSENTMGGVTADTNNHLVGFSYDTSGNTLGDGNYTYTWDGESQMTTAAGVTYTYDGDGRRVKKSNGKLYWYGSGGEILAETDSAGTVTAEYVFFGGKRVAVLPAGSTAQFYVEDFLGSSRVVTTNTGAVCYDADFTPFGAERMYTNTCTLNAYKFEGKERDSETQNDDFGARYYTWRFGRWLSSDWSAVPVAVPYANLTNPQTLNLYSMVADDPESFADLGGHQGNGSVGTYNTDADAKAASDSMVAQADITSTQSAGTAEKAEKSGDASAWNNQQSAQNHPPVTRNATVANQEFKTRNGAAMAAEKVALPLTKDANKSGKTDWEYGGWIVKAKDGKYTYTEPMRGAERGKTDIDNMIVPEGFRKVAAYHTHPDNGSWGEGFSGWDMAISDDKRMRDYVGMTWSGNVRKYDPGVTKRNGYGVSGDLVGHIDF